jgi:hypothetical protein
MGLSKGLRLVRGLRRQLDEDERNRIAEAIREHLKARGELVARITGHGAGLRRWILFTVCRDLAVHLGRAVPCKRAAGGVRNQRRGHRGAGRARRILRAAVRRGHRRHTEVGISGAVIVAYRTRCLLLAMR